MQGAEPAFVCLHKRLSAPVVWGCCAQAPARGFGLFICPIRFCGGYLLLIIIDHFNRFFVTDGDRHMRIIAVYANEKIEETDFGSCDRISSMDENSLTLNTCENERMDRGYFHHRIIIAKLVV